MVKTKISLTIDENIHSLFKKYCEEGSMKVSPRVEQAMKTILKAEGYILN